MTVSVLRRLAQATALVAIALAAGRVRQGPMWKSISAR